MGACCSTPDNVEASNGVKANESGDGTTVTKHPANVIDQVLNVNPFTTKKLRHEAHHLRNIFTAPLKMVDASYKAPFLPKTPEEEQFIRNAVLHNFVFVGLNETEMQTIVNALEPYEADRDDTIIKEGDKGDYFYILREGEVKFVKENKVVGKGTRGDSFGELALLYSAPRAASVVAITSCRLYRLDQTTFRSILQSHNITSDNQKLKLLKNVPFLHDLDAADLNKLASSLKPRQFKSGEYLVRKGDEGDAFYVIQEGKVELTDISVGTSTYPDLTIGAGEFFGERALIKKEPRAANAIALTDVKTLTIDSDTFVTVLGDMGSLVLRANDKRKLQSIGLFKESPLGKADSASLVGFIHDQTFPKGSVIEEEGKKVEPALYLVRDGKVELKSASDIKIIEDGGYFGEDQLQIHSTALKTGAAYTVTALEDSTVGVLYLEDCGVVVDSSVESVTEADIELRDLKKHKILGAGTFGQVWLVSHERGDGSRKAYALKIQSKYDLIEDNQAEGVVNERDLMAQLSHPFIINLVNSYQDPQRVYMLLGLVQGGELLSVMHTETSDGIPESSAKFYSAGVIEGLTAMHNKRIIYRDLKPENVLIDAQGYPVIVDMGFAKYVENKTYTFCGTPLYLPPEVILSRGHDKGADHWSFAVMLYEMLIGYTPFYEEGMDQMSLFKAIVRAKYTIPTDVSMSLNLKELLRAMLVDDPSFRLGSLADGSNGILRAEWFKDIDFNQLRRKEIKAPWVPDIKDALDCSNFEDWSHLKDKDKVTDPPLTKKQQDIFKTF